MLDAFLPCAGELGDACGEDSRVCHIRKYTIIMYKKPSEQSTPAVFYNLTIEEIKKICYNRTETWISYTTKRGEAGQIR